MTLQEYEELATKILIKQCGHSQVTDENIGLVIHYLVKADMSFDESKGFQLSTLRYSLTKKAIRRILYKKKKVREIHCCSLNKIVKRNTADTFMQNLQLSDVIEDKRATSDTEYIETINFVNELLDNSELSANERKCIEDFYINGKTRAEIASDINKTFQRVSQLIIKGLKKIHDKNKQRFENRVR